MANRSVHASVNDIFPPQPSATLPSSTASPRVTTDSPESGSVTLASGRSLEWQAGEDGVEQVRIRGVEGEVELDVVLGEGGPRLRFKAADLAIEADGKVQVDCDEFHVRAKSKIVQETDGDLAEQVAGNAVSVVKGDLRMWARTAGVRATRGDVRLKANDDVKLEGERIKLNC